MNARLPIVFVALTTLHCAGEGRLGGLLQNSPFGSPRTTAAPADTSGQPLEFRGSAEENGVLWFSVFDTTTKRSLWRKLGDSDDKLAVRQYDPASNTLTVEYQSRTLSLALRSAPRIDGPPMLPVPVPGQQPPVILTQGQATAAVATGDNAQRLQQIAEEIRRRRALRQQNTQPAGARP